MDIGRFIRDRRITLGITQKEVADFIGVSVGTVSRWESSHINNMRRDRIAKLAKILQVEPSEIMDIDGLFRKNDGQAAACDLLDILFANEPEFLSKIKSIQLDGKLNEPGVAAHLTGVQKETLRNIIKMTYNEAVRNGGRGETVVTKQ